MVNSGQGKRSAGMMPTAPASGHAGQPGTSKPVESMFIPRVGQRVRVAGQDDEYIVMRVDRRRYLADLMSMKGMKKGVKRMETGVLLIALNPIPPEKPRRLQLGTILRKDN